MQHNKDNEQRSYQQFIQLLNVNQINVMYVDDSFYAVDSFELPDYQNVHHLEILGADITDLIENRPVTFAAPTMQQTALFQDIASRKKLRRTFHRDTKFCYYSSF